ncbi:hypothetical protein [Clostridium perfringens]|uniref:hypothetical protein n=1 Tax=Clostridium perfringens TaxID=1502 RepID=UPI0024BD5A18|nr:hypothetical protein [Clostridium perfringens]CAJ1760380.1 hypothetical protein AUSP0115_00031 [uncultured phage]
MAVRSNSIKFSKASISQNEEGEFIIEETKKDEIIVTNFTNALLEFAGVEGLEISIGKKSETVSEE